MTVHFMIDGSDIRRKCVDHNFYTCGDNEDYTKMFNAVELANEVNERKGLTVDDIYIIAQDIAQHSDNEVLEERYGIDTDDQVRGIVNDLIYHERAYLW